MSPKLSSEHLAKSAIIYIRQSSMGQVVGNLESQKRQYALVDAAKAAGFAGIITIDDDLGRSGSGLTVRPGFQKLVADVCAGHVGAVYCLEASRLARNGRDWHHLIDLCAIAGALVIDLDGVYDPRHVNDRLLLGLKGTMSEYELTLMRQRGLAARDAKASRGELKFTLPPGFCWSESDRIEIDPDEHVAEAIRLVFRKFRDLGSARQVFLWARDADIRLPVVRINLRSCKIIWRQPAYHSIMQILRSPIYAGAYAFGRRGNRTSVVDGRARKTTGHHRSISEWNVLIKDHHEGYLSWSQYEENQVMLCENAYMQKRAARKAARGGRALLTGLVRCGVCGRMMRVFYGMQSGHAHRYQCRGDDGHVGAGLCIGIGGLRVDRAVASAMLDAVSDRGIEAATMAADQAARQADDVRHVLMREIEGARYDAQVAARRHELVDPAKRHVARELEARWNVALERLTELEQRLKALDAKAAISPSVDRTALMRLAQDLPAAWNAPGTDAGTKQRLTRVLVQEVLVSLDAVTNEAVLTVHWTGGRHTELRVARVRTGRYSGDKAPNAVDAVRELGGRWPDREVAVALNRMRCRGPGEETWTMVRVKALRERLGISPYDPDAPREETISVSMTAQRLGICVGSVHLLIRRGVLPARQAMAMAPWEVPVAALSSEAVRIGVRDVVERRPKNVKRAQEFSAPMLPGL